MMTGIRQIHLAIMPDQNMVEKFVVRDATRYLVCRAGWMMGAGPKKDKKFIQKVMSQIKAGKRELFVVNDKDGTPTYTQDFAKNVKALIEKEYSGNVTIWFAEVRLHDFEGYLGTFKDFKL